MKAYWLGGILIIGMAVLYALNTSMNKTEIGVISIGHASVVLKWGDTVVYVDPTGAPEKYADMPKPRMVLITHEHGDHFSTSTLEHVVGADTILVVPPIVADRLPDALTHNLVVLKNGDITRQNGLTIHAIPAYNLREEDKNRHLQGTGNGYVLEGGGERVYVAGDTEDIPEMRALKNIDIAFIPMNLPYTMSVEKAADAVLAFKPAQVYPYHYRTPTGLSDVAKFKQLVNAGNSAIEVVQLDWYSH